MYFPPPQKLYPHGLAGAPQVAGAGGALVGLTGAWVGAAGGAVAVGLMVAFGVGVASGVGLTDSVLVPSAVPPPTPPVPDGKVVGFEDDDAWLVAHPESETSRSAAMAQLLTVLTFVAESLDRTPGKRQCARQVSNVAMPRRASLLNPPLSVSQSTGLFTVGQCHGLQG